MARLITDFDEFKSIRSDIRKRYGSVISNFIPDTEITNWIKNRELWRIDAPRGVFISRRANNVWHIWYFFPSITSMEESVELLSDNMLDEHTPAIIEEISRSDQPSINLSGVWGHMMTLQRMVVGHDMISHLMVEIESVGTESIIRKANASELLQLQDLLICNFNPIAERIPDLSELGEILGGKGDIMVAVGADGSLNGLIIWSDRYGTTELRYWWINSAMRGTGLGSRLLRTYLNHGVKRCKQLSLFVDRLNSNAIEKYGHFGFVPDNCFDHIYRIR